MHARTDLISTAAIVAENVCLRADLAEVAAERAIERHTLMILLRWLRTTDASPDEPELIRGFRAMVWNESDELAAFDAAFLAPA